MMSFQRITTCLVAVSVAAAVAPAQQAQVSAVAINPANVREVWVCNRDNNSISVVDTLAGVTTHEIDVGVRPRSLAFSRDGAKVFVANQRGNVPVSANFATGFTGSEIRGTVSVIDVASKSVTNTLTSVGTEPYGVAVSPNGKYFAVSGFRSGTVKLFNTATLAPAASFEYLWNLSQIPTPYTIADADSNRDGMADLGEPRGFAIRGDSKKIYVTHDRSPYISVLNVTLDAAGNATGVSLDTKIDLNTYPYDPIYNPTPVQTIQSQGVPRFAEDIALSPAGDIALVPHLLHNINHDVNFAFPSWLPGAFANRVYPALTAIDMQSNTFNQSGDHSRRLHNELADPIAPAEYAAYGEPGRNAIGLATIGGKGNPILGGDVRIRVRGLPTGQTAFLYFGTPTNVPMGSIGTKLVNPTSVYTIPPTGVISIPVPNNSALEGQVLYAQAGFFQGTTLKNYSNGLRIRLSANTLGRNKMGHRAGHPSRVLFNGFGTRALMLNRGSEDLFLYQVTGSNFQLMTVYPPRIDFTPRASLDTNTATGDLPLGMAMAYDTSTVNEDAFVYVMNELTRTLSVLRVDFVMGTIVKERNQIPTLLGTDLYTVSERLGDELFEDASRAQTTGAPGTIGEFNNSCASCHFEGGEDGNVWQRGNGPRSTMPVYGGSLATGLILWKGVRLNMGETGPMFGGENGGHGVLSDVEQQALVDAHNITPVPLNPNLDPTTGQLTPLAAFGKDLFFGTDSTGLNPTLRRAGCAECHPMQDAVSGALRGFTADFLDPTLTSGENLASFDPTCFSLQSNIVALNVRNVNSGVNVDFNHDNVPDPDRNADGYNDIETYVPMNADKADPFTRDDGNSYKCPTDPNDPNSPLKIFLRDMRAFSIPTKLGVFSTGPYFHDHSAYSLRTIVDPEAQALSPIYGDPAWSTPQTYPGLNKFFNEFHDVRGHEQFAPGASKVQINLVSGANVNTDIEALLAFIQSL